MIKVLAAEPRCKKSSGDEEFEIEALRLDVVCEQLTYFWSSLLSFRKGGREATTGNTQANSMRPLSQFSFLSVS